MRDFAAGRVVWMAWILLAVASGAKAQAKPVTLALFDFESKDLQDPTTGAKVADLLRVDLGRDPDIHLVERDKIDEVLKEMELGLTGIVEGGSAARVGHLLGAQVLVVGRAFAVDKDLVLMAKVIGTETTRVFAEMARGPEEAQISPLVQGLGSRIKETLLGNLDSLLGADETETDLVQLILPQIRGKKLPTVSLGIQEHHVSGPISDPAAKTELTLILLACGFTVTDEALIPGEAPDVSIQGEAFSAFAGRRGDLISCKARLEVRAVSRAGAEILAADRQTAVAVDLAEPVAAKTALETAMRDLAVRFIPSMVSAWEEKRNR